jgi:endogenous inhibitor of DNA gyrase (YacG/DUF329 family)
MAEPEVTYLYLVQCSVCGLMMTPRGYDGDGRPFVQERCPDCDAEADVPDETDAYYSLAESPR